MRSPLIVSSVTCLVSGHLFILQHGLLPFQHRMQAPRFNLSEPSSPQTSTHFHLEEELASVANWQYKANGVGFTMFSSPIRGHQNESLGSMYGYQSSISSSQRLCYLQSLGRSRCGQQTLHTIWIEGILCTIQCLVSSFYSAAFAPSQCFLRRVCSSHAFLNRSSNLPPSHTCISRVLHP